MYEALDKGKACMQVGGDYWSIGASKALKSAMLNQEPYLLRSNYKRSLNHILNSLILGLTILGDDSLIRPSLWLRTPK